MPHRFAMVMLVLIATHAELPAHAAGDRILFVGGAPFASDSPEAMAHSRDGDRTVVKFGADERYDLPDALIRGG